MAQESGSRRTASRRQGLNQDSGFRVQEPEKQETEAENLQTGATTATSTFASFRQGKEETW
jgi:hypothetical protein